MSASPAPRTGVILGARPIDISDEEKILREIVQVLAALTALEVEQRDALQQAMTEAENERMETGRLLLQHTVEIEKLSTEAAELRQKVEHLRAENVFLATYIRKNLDENGDPVQAMPAR